MLDGVTGIGGRPGLAPFARPWVDAIRDRAWLIAVDTPSGQPVEGGPVVADAVFADETVTFGAPKPVHLLPPTEAACGLLTVLDIGLDLEDVEPTAHPLDVVNVLAEDVPEPSLSVDEALANAPDADGGFFGVPARERA